MRRIGLTHACVAALLMIGSWTAAGAPPASASDTPGSGSPTASAASTRSAPASAALLQAMQRDFGLSPAEAEERLAAEQRATALEPKARKAAGPAYGGAWFDEKSEKLTVAVTPDADAATVRSLRSSGAAVRTVEHSARRLDATVSRLDRLDAPSGVSSWSVDPAANTVVVNVVKGEPADNDVRRFLSEAREAGPVTVRTVRAAAETFAAGTVGGDPYYTGNVRCSIGFSVHGGFVTAGHCGGVGGQVRGWDRSYGAAEVNFGRLMKQDLAPYRDELVISTKAGWDMWPGPYGQGGGSRKYMLASLDQSLKRMGLDYVDIFYSHRLDATTPLEETMGALDTAVRQGKALYVGISSYDAERTREAVAVLRDLGTPLLIHQPSYSMLNRWIETEGLVDVAQEEGFGIIGFTALAQGLLTGRYLDGVPQGSRATQGKSFDTAWLTDDMLHRLRALNDIAARRGQTLAQMALAWALRDRRVTSLVIGASRTEQLEQNVAALDNLDFSGADAGAEIDRTPPTAPATLVARRRRRRPPWD
ncbi:hypothetical protein SHIRM173S_04790 [Streptomyces hirsutus]